MTAIEEVSGAANQERRLDCITADSEMTATGLAVWQVNNGDEHAKSLQRA
jgi:hypothetical protein